MLFSPCLQWTTVSSPPQNTPKLKCAHPKSGTGGHSGDLLAALWPGGSQGLSSAASDKAMTLSAYHKQLLAMRVGSGLEGIEVGPMLGRGSYGRVYKVRCQPQSLVSSGPATPTDYATCSLYIWTSVPEA